MSAMAKWTTVNLTAMTERIPLLPSRPRFASPASRPFAQAGGDGVGLPDYLGASSPSTVLLRCQRREAMV